MIADEFNLWFGANQKRNLSAIQEKIYQTLKHGKSITGAPLVTT